MFFVTYTQTEARTKLRHLYVPRSEDFKVYLDDNASIFFLWKIDLHTNIFAGYFHDIFDLFQKRRLRMSKVVGDSHRLGFVPNNFGLFRFHCYFGASCSINFKKSSLEKKVFFAPIYQNI